jgi:hypothetical protein
VAHLVTTGLTLDFDIFALGKQIYKHAVITIGQAVGKQSSAALDTAVANSATHKHLTGDRVRRRFRLHFTDGRAAVSLMLAFLGYVKVER